MKLLKLSYTVLVISLFSFIFLVNSAITQDANKNLSWTSPSFDDHSTSFNPQNAFNADIIEYLEQKWMTTLSQELVFYGNETIHGTSNPLLVNGLIYMVDRSQILVALKADDDSVVWTQQLSVSNPLKYSVIDAGTDVRYITYFDNTVWVLDLDCSITGFNAYNGNPIIEIPPQVLCGDVSPESKPRDIVIRVISAPIFYEEDRIIIASTSGLAPKDRSLSYVVGINLDTQDIVWKTSLVTSPGEILSPGWGQWSIDQEEGIIYIGTGSPSPEWNATYRNGENKYGNSIIALRASTGEIIWNYQTNPHDINNYGCTGNIILGNIEGKKTVYSACMNGYVYALDADTGNLVWYFNPPNIKRLNSENADFVKTNTYDPNKPWLNYPSTDPVVQCPGVFGAVSFNIAMGYDTIYVSTFNSCSEISVSPVTSMGETGITNKSLIYENVGPVNSTLYAIDAITGDVKWSHYFDDLAIRGGITVSGGLVYLPSPKGSVYAFDANSGLNVYTKSFGTLGVFYPPIIGADAYGNWSLIQLVAGTPILHGLGELSGYLFSLAPPSGLIDTATVVTETTDTGLSMIITYSAIAVAIVLLVAIMIVYYRRRS